MNSLFSRTSSFTQVVIYIALKHPIDIAVSDNSFTQVVIYIALKRLS